MAILPSRILGLGVNPYGDYRPQPSQSRIGPAGHLVSVSLVSPKKHPLSPRKGVHKPIPPLAKSGQHS